MQLLCTARERGRSIAQSDVSAPDLIGPIYAQPPEQVGICIVPLRRFAGVWLSLDRHYAFNRINRRFRFSLTRCPSLRKCHVINWPSGYCRRQCPDRLPNPEEWCLKELFINLAHEREV